MITGDRVFHKNLKRYTDEYGIIDELCITISQLEKVKE